MAPSSEKMPILPHSLDAVRPPFYLSPSRFADLLRCPLSVLHGLRSSDQLPPHPTAILGTLVHDAMHALRRDPDVLREDPSGAARAVFEGLLSETEARLMEDAATSRLVPLDRAVGMTRWLQRKSRLLNWAGSLARRDEHVRPVGRGEGEGRRSSARVGNDTAGALPTGSERTLKVHELRLAGRVDLIERDADGTVHVTDLKSGAVSDEGGGPLAEYSLQLRLYGLMVEALAPGSAVRLWLEGSERVEVPWDEAGRSEVAEQLRGVLSTLPEDSPIAADSLANPGRHCRWCRVRHRCPGYRRAAPTWWGEVSTTEPVAPFDTWGTPLDVLAKEDGSYDVTLRDAADRPVMVSGLASAPWAGDVAEGTLLWFFGLEPSETLPLHGAYAHPRNFHERRHSRNRSDALRLQVFVGPDDSGQFPVHRRRMVP